MAYPHSKSETIADGVVHLFGLMFALPATAVLIVQVEHSKLLLTAVVLYGLS